MPGQDRRRSAPNQEPHRELSTTAINADVSRRSTGTSTEQNAVRVRHLGHAGFRTRGRPGSRPSLADDRGDALTDPERTSPTAKIRTWSSRKAGQRHTVRILAGPDEALGIEIEATIEIRCSARPRSSRRRCLTLCLALAGVAAGPGHLAQGSSPMVMIRTGARFTSRRVQSASRSCGLRACP